MAIKFEGVKAGDTLYAVYRQKMGYTTMSRTVSMPVRVLEVDYERGQALLSRNGNPARWTSRSQVEKLRRSPYKPKGRS